MGESCTVPDLWEGAIWYLVCGRELYSTWSVGGSDTVPDLWEGAIWYLMCGREPYSILLCEDTLTTLCNILVSNDFCSVFAKVQDLQFAYKYQFNNA